MISELLGESMRRSLDRQTPSCARERWLASLVFAVKVVLDKYFDHIPLERQVRILERHDLVVTSQTLWDMALAIAKRLEIVDAALLEIAG